MIQQQQANIPSPSVTAVIETGVGSQLFLTGPSGVYAFCQSMQASMQAKFKAEQILSIYRYTMVEVRTPE